MEETKKPDFRVTDLLADRIIAAEEILLNILNGEFPSANRLRMYGENKLWYVTSKIEEVIEEIIEPYKNSGNIVRHLSDIRESDLFVKHRESQSSTFFLAAESKLNKWEMPDKDLMQEFYGVYEPNVWKSFEAFQILRKVRNCDRPITNHSLRTSTMANALGYDKSSFKPYCTTVSLDKLSFKPYYTALWGEHDAVEDLVFAIRMPSGRIKYGLENLSEFLEDYIHEDMIKDIMMVTNKADIILDHLDSKHFNLTTKDEVNHALESLLNEKKYSIIHENAQKMIDILSNTDLPSGRDSYQADIRVVFYKSMFLKDLAEQAYANNHFALFEGKGTVDLLDNVTSMLPENIKRARRAVLKIRWWADDADEILTRAKNEKTAFYPTFFAQKVWQTMNYANYAARKFLISYLAEPVTETGHLDVALRSIDILKPVLYTKVQNEKQNANG
jgi:hypothetical protein